MFELKENQPIPAKSEERVYGLFRTTQSQLAKELSTTFRTINEIVNEKRNISPEMAIKFARYFGTSEEIWMNLQNQYELYLVKMKRRDILRNIRPYNELHGQAL